MFFEQLFVLLVRADRYDGPKVKENTAKSEAKAHFNAIKNADNLWQD